MGTSDPSRIRRQLEALVLLATLTAGCDAPAEKAATKQEDTWSVTAWGEHFEVFPEVGLLAVGEIATAHTHVTSLDGFTPLADGVVAIVLTGPGGEQVFAADQALRPGIFAVEIQPASAGEFEMFFRIEGPESSERIRGGKVRIGTTEQPGGLLVAPAPKGGTDGGQPLDFLKEEQWRSDFATSWVRPGRLSRSVSGLAQVRPPAGGEAWITSPVDGVLQPSTTASRGWPFVGQHLERGSELFQVIPRVAADRSLGTLEAELATVSAELETARARLSRLEELLELDAASRREVEEARVRVATLEARHTAADGDLGAARSSRGSATTTRGLTLRAPFAGEIAGVATSPGATVAAGEPLARLVRTDVLWFEVRLSPAGARQVAREGVRGLVLTDPELGSVRIEEDLRLVSVAPEMSAATGTVTVLFEAPPAAGLVLGTTMQAQVLTSEEQEGLVVPASAVVDDGGVSVVYLQLSGESFIRQQVRVLERQGDRVLVDRLAPGQRLVSLGGEAIRRSALMASGEAHGHVH